MREIRAPLNEPETKTGATPINEAAYSNRLPLIPYLLQFHPDLLLPDRRGYTPLENAIRMRNEDVAILLLKAAPEEQKTTSLLNKMLAACAKKNESHIADLLLSEGATANASVPDAATPLDIAVSAGGADVARILLARGADPNRSDHDGTSPLENAALKGIAEIVAMLLDRGANVDWINSDSGTTALYGAAAFGRADVVMLLLQRGASLNLCGQRKITPYKAALENGFNDIATQLQHRGGSDTCSDFIRN
jgi:cytohesin